MLIVVAAAEIATRNRERFEEAGRAIIEASRQEAGSSYSSQPAASTSASSSNASCVSLSAWSQIGDFTSASLGASRLQVMLASVMKKSSPLHRMMSPGLIS